MNGVGWHVIISQVAAVSFAHSTNFQHFFITSISLKSNIASNSPKFDDFYPKNLKLCNSVFSQFIKFLTFFDHFDLLEIKYCAKFTRIWSSALSGINSINFVLLFWGEFLSKWRENARARAVAVGLRLHLVEKFIEFLLSWASWLCVTGSEVNWRRLSQWAEHTLQQFSPPSLASIFDQCQIS